MEEPLLSRNDKPMTGRRAFIEAIRAIPRALCFGGRQAAGFAVD
jgi:hypothetical protein